MTSANAADAEPVKELLPELQESCDSDEDLTVVADSAYGTGETRRALQKAGAKTVIKSRPDRNTRGGFPKSAFEIDLEAKTVTCPAGVVTADYTALSDGSQQFHFPAEACASCSLRAQCTSSRDGRRITVGPHEDLLGAVRAYEDTEEFKQIYNGKRPTVERMIFRVVRNGGRKARYRGRKKVTEQITLKAAGENLVRMLRLGLVWRVGLGWTLA